MVYVIYRHTSCVTNKAYIGYTHLTVEERWNRHVHNARSQSTLYFHRAIRAHGENTWKHEALASCASLSDAKQTEIDLIAQYHTNDPQFGYNMTIGGDGRTGPVSYETRKKISTSLKLRETLLSDDERQLRSERLSQSLRGKPKTEAGRNAQRGKKRSLETRAKMSASRMGMKLSEECKAKIRTAVQNQVFGPLSEEHKQKISEGLRLAHQRRKEAKCSTQR